MIYGYARVSTDGQSVAAQVAGLRAAGASKVFREVASGAKTDRAQLRRAIAALQVGDVLMVTRLDRLSTALASAPQPAEATGRPPARQGKKAIAFWVDPGASTQLRIAAATMNRSVQDIMTEALEDWFREHRLPGLAAASNGRE